MKIAIGQVLLNQFRVDEFLASGGMGAVYRVWDLKRNVPLAMKVLHSNLGEDPSVFKSFKREAISLKKLAHPNIVPFYGLYEEGETAFLLQRFIDGPTLKELLNVNKGRPIPVADALVYLKTIAAALHFAHSSTVVHCDVKPGNVLLDRGGNIYLTDFGIARHADSTTTTMVGLGTPAYMAPEQILEKSVTPATDIYALGVMLFEMVTGQRPFQGNEKGTETAGPTVRERIIYGHLQLAPPDPRRINPQIPEAMARAILKALEKDPKQRYTSTQEFLEAICRAMDLSLAQIPDRVQVQGWETAEKDSQRERGGNQRSLVLSQRRACMQVWERN
jgi:eukaryotic-like serine/threonine-protein kinase